MTKEAALYNFFSSFDIPAYPVTSVPDSAEMPYITYDMQTASFGDEPVSLTVNVWYYTESEATPNAKVNEIAQKITRGGCVISCDDGAIWIKKGTPWCTSIQDDDNNIKRRYLNVDLEYLTIN